MNIDSIKSIIYMYILLYSDQGGRSAKSHGIKKSFNFVFLYQSYMDTYVINSLLLCTINRMSSIAYMLNCASALQRL